MRWRGLNTIVIRPSRRVASSLGQARLKLCLSVVCNDQSLAALAVLFVWDVLFVLAVLAVLAVFAVFAVLAVLAILAVFAVIHNFSSIID